MHTYVNREGWNAEPPRFSEPLDPDKVMYFVVHYTGASRSQTMRQLQWYSMEDRGARDVLYNAAVKNGTEFEGRNHNKGGHTEGLNEESYGVVVFGFDGDVNAADMDTLEEIYVRECLFFKRVLIPIGHQQAPGNNTSCPGPRLLDFVNNRLKLRNPFDGGNGMGSDVTQVDVATTYRAHALLGDLEEARFTLPGETKETVEPNRLRERLTRMEEKIDALSSGGVSDEQLERVLRKILREGLGVGEV